ncbi:glycine/betaine ABC transporter permease [Longimycelium tulufanense]|uniref:Glycine/betaine ABC transporter permease n=1 Tax=Longimycelium tulufanense TaxID=907463 RepID=A0A8J3FS92_9PSEU|nr:ABC transporter permease [Longimycelium tulufanense]GGM32821.1 glycine/betaine ABC transporter permease [Longimycelium tulufanense]
MLQEILSWLTDPAHWSGPDGIPHRLLEHLGYTVVAALAAIAIGVPLGLFVGHTGRGGLALVGLTNGMRALPTLGLVTFLFLVLGSTQTSTLIALVVLAVPPVLAGTYAGVQDTPRGVVDAAQGMGMTGWQRLWRVEVPNATPLLLGGIRNAVLQLVATTTVAAFVGLGGLGRYVLDGLRVYAYPKVAAGALLVAALAVVLDLLLAGLQRVIVPRGLRLAAVTRRRGGVAREPERVGTDVVAGAVAREGANG